MKNSKKVKNLVIAAMFCAIIFVATAYLPRIPILGGAGGYVHIGDAFIYIAASVLPMPFAIAAAGIGGFLADSLTGFLIWAPGTLIIKAAIASCFSSKSSRILCRRNIIAAVGACAVTIAGYYLYEALFISDFSVSLASVPFNAIQGAASAALFVLIALVLDKIKFKDII